MKLNYELLSVCTQKKLNVVIIVNQPVALPHVHHFGVCDAMLDSSIVQEVKQVLDGCWQ